ncbi:MAG: hypothetical protein LUI12_05030 [Clostridiales bacterium]|nr:hypothetical protein [Clostridiales bacterium]
MKTYEKIKKIADTYGYEPQSRQCMEECAELIQAINKFWRKELDCGRKTIFEVPICSPCEKNLIEEIADVQIMVWQMEYLLSAGKYVDDFIENKINRQIKRIEESR